MTKWLRTCFRSEETNTTRQLRAVRPRPDWVLGTELTGSESHYENQAALFACGPDIAEECCIRLHFLECDKWTASLFLEDNAEVLSRSCHVCNLSQLAQQQQIHTEKVKCCQLTDLSKKCMCVHIVLKLFCGFENSQNKGTKNWIVCESRQTQEVEA